MPTANPLSHRTRGRAKERQPSAAPRWSMAKWALLASAICTSLGAFGIAVPWWESADYELHFVLAPLSEESSLLVADIAEELAQQRGVKLAFLHLDAETRQALEGKLSLHRTRLVENTSQGPLNSLDLLDKMCKSHSSRARIVVLVRPYGPSADLQQASDLAARLRAAGVSVVAIDPPPESLPQATFLTPAQVVAPAEPRHARNDAERSGGTFRLLLGNLPQGSEVRLQAYCDRLAASAAIDDPSLGTAQFHAPRLENGLKPGSVKALLPSHDEVTLQPQSYHAAVVYPNHERDVLDGWAEGVEASVVEHGRTIQRDLHIVDQAPPRILYIPLAALVAPPHSGARYFPAVPRNPDERDVRRQARLPWNLLWMQHRGLGGHRSHREKVAGLTLLWPRERLDDLPAGSLKASQQGDLRGFYDELERRGAIINTLPTDLAAYSAVILDASANLDAVEDFQLHHSPAGDQFLPSSIVDSGGVVIQARTPSEVDPTLFARFKTALADYLDDGGCLALIGGGRSQFIDPDQLKLPVGTFVNFRSLLAYLAPGLDNFQASNAPPRRVVLAFDDSASGSDGSVDSAYFETLPPLASNSQTYKAANEEESEDVQRQLTQFVGYAPATNGHEIEIMSRPQLAGIMMRNLGLHSRRQTSDRESSSLIENQTLDTKGDFGAYLVAYLRRVLNHPELNVEVQGRAAYRRAYPALAAPSSSFPREWLMQQPFPASAAAFIPAWRDRYASQLDADPIANPPTIAFGDRVDTMEFELFLRYVSSQGYTSANELPYPKHVLFMVSDGDDLNSGGWPIVSAAGRLTSRPFGPSTEVANLPGQHFLFLTRAADPKLAQVSRSVAGSTALADWFDPATTDVWRATACAASSSPLYQKRGRYGQLLARALVSEIQSIPCETTEHFGRDFAQGLPETADFLHRLITEQLRVSFSPAYRPEPSTRWRTLVRAIDHSEPEKRTPLVSVAECRRGTVLLVACDANLETALYQRRFNLERSDVDYSATTWRPASAADGVLRTLAYGYRLERLPRKDGVFASYRLIRRTIDDGIWPPIITSNPHTTDDWQIESVTIRPAMGLGQRASTAVKTLNLRAAGRPHAFELSTDAGDQPSAALSKDENEVTIEVPTSRAATIEQFANARRSFTLPPLIEFKLSAQAKADGALPAQRTSVFVMAVLPGADPNSQAAIAHHEWRGPSPIAMIDMLLEKYRVQSRYRLTLLPDRSGWHLSPIDLAAAPASSLHLSLCDCEAQLVQFATKTGLDSRDLVIVPEVARNRHLSLTISSGSKSEVHELFLPSLPAHWNPLVPFVAPLQSARGRQSPRPDECVLDTLATGTMPSALVEHLLRPRRLPELSPAERGVIHLPLVADSQSDCVRYIKACCAARTTAKSSRDWYLLALLALMLSVVRIKPKLVGR